MEKRIISILVSLAFLAFPGMMCASAPGFIFEHYSTDDGLSYDHISDICQDSRGYLWLCTWYGLSRFDGNGFVNFTMKPGDDNPLSHNRILSVEEDMSGYLWLVTYDHRLVRFDPEGEQFVSIIDDVLGYGEDMSLSVLHCSRDGNVWVGVNSGALCCIGPGLEVPARYGPASTGGDVKCFFEDSHGGVYFSGAHGLFQVKDGSCVRLSANADVFAMQEFGGRMYFLSPGDLLAVDRMSLEQTHLWAGDCGCYSSITESGGRLWVGLSDSAIAEVDTTAFSLDIHKCGMGRTRMLYPDSGGLVWVVTDRTGIWSWNPSRRDFRHYEHSRNVMSYYSDTLARVVQGRDRLWVKMNDYGFGWYDRDKDEIVPLDNVREMDGCRMMNGVTCFCEDASGVLWLSTAQRGLERVTPLGGGIDRFSVPTKFGDNVASSEIRAMLLDSRSRLWVGAKSRELYVYDGEMNLIQHYPDAVLPDPGVIYSIFEDRDGNVWIGTKGSGLIKAVQTGGSWSFTRYVHDGSASSLSSDDVYSIAQDKGGKIWIGTYGGGISMLDGPDADSFHTVANSFPLYPLDGGNRIRSVHCTPDGMLLIGTVDGLIWTDPSAKPELMEFHKARKMPSEIHSLGNNDITYIFTDSRERSWICTFGGGLNRIRFEDGVPRFDVICTSDGLSSNIVLSAVDDAEGNIWVATDTGISRVVDPAGDNPKVRNFTRYDGVSSSRFSEAACVRMPSGELLFGSLDDIYRVNPALEDSEDTDPRLVISEVLIDGRRVPVGSKLKVPAGYSFFRIGFSSLDFSLRTDCEFQYRLQGHDKDWIAASGSGMVTYSGIRPGNYRFSVRRAELPQYSATLSVKVIPTIWQSVPAVIIYILMAVALLVVLARMLYNTIRLKNDVKLEQDLNDLKMRFFTNISHELRTPLTLILGGIDDIKKNPADTERTAYSVNMVSRNARRMMTLVNQLLDIRKIVSGKMRLKVSRMDMVKVLEDIYGDFRDMASDRNIELLFTRSCDSLAVWGDTLRIEALVYNLLSNAFKFTPDGGRIEMALLYHTEDRTVDIVVKDNGIGIPKDKQSAIFEQFFHSDSAVAKGMPSSGVGLSFCKEIAAMHGGDIRVESRENEGSVFTVTIPVDKDHFGKDDAVFIDAAAGVPEGVDSPDSHKVVRECPSGAMKVLLVEDNVELRVYEFNCLAGKYELRDAGNGEEALGIISGGWMPDIIVTDLMMPQMDGIELIGRIRADFATSHIPVIAVTARHENDAHLEATRYGADGYISKPFTVELLAAKIERLLERRRELLSALTSPFTPAGGRAGKVSFSPGDIVITDRDEELIGKVMDWLEKNSVDPDASVDDLAVYVGMGRTSMYNKIKGLTGKSPVELIQNYRMEKATLYLRSGQYSISETSYMVGFSDPGYFSRSFKKHFGMTPADYIKTKKK